MTLIHNTHSQLHFFTWITSKLNVLQSFTSIAKPVDLSVSIPFFLHLFSEISVLKPGNSSKAIRDVRISLRQIKWFLLIISWIFLYFNLLVRPQTFNVRKLRLNREFKLVAAGKFSEFTDLSWSPLTNRLKLLVSEQIRPFVLVEDEMSEAGPPACYCSMPNSDIFSSDHSNLLKSA